MRTAALVALAAFAMYMASFHSIHTVDAASNVLLSYSLVRDGDPFLDEFRSDRGRISYWEQNVRGHDVIYYQAVTAMFAAPFAAIGVAVGIEPPDPASVTVIGKLAAAAAAAGSVFFVHLGAARLAGRRIALVTAALYAFGTATWPVSAGTLWQHGPAQLFVALGLFLLLSADPRWRARSGLGFGLAAATRYHTAVFALGAAVTVFLRDRRGGLRFLAWTLPALALQSVYDLATFGQLLVTRVTPYGPSGDRIGATVGAVTYSGAKSVVDAAEAAAGLLVSPSRGLFVFSPFLVLGAYEIARRALRRDRLGMVLGAQLAGAVAIYAVYASFHEWWGGHTYGNRYLAEALPLLALGTALWARRMRTRPWARRVLGVTGAFAIVVAAIGATSYDWRTWSWESLGRYPALVWRVDVWQPLYTALRAPASWDGLTIVTAAVMAAVTVVTIRLWRSPEMPRGGSPGDARPDRAPRPRSPARAARTPPAA